MLSANYKKIILGVAVLGLIFTFFMSDRVVYAQSGFNYNDVIQAARDDGMSEQEIADMLSNLNLDEKNTNQTADPGATTNLENIKSSSAIVAILHYTVGILVSWVAGFLGYIIKIGGEVTQLGGVRQAWNIVLGFTNLGFVVALIVVAFATILHFDNYGMKRTLVKLIAAALLVNFSLVITSAAIDLSTIMSNFMLKPITGDKGAEFIATKMAAVLQINEIAGMDTNQKSSLSDRISNIIGMATNPIGKILGWAASAIFVIIFTIFVILIFLSLAVMLLIRILYLIILAIFSPIIWLCWIFPDTKKHWNKWWSQLIRWNIFAPVVLFVVYVALLLAGSFDGMASFKAVEASSESVGFQGGTFLTGRFFQNSIKLVIVLGFLVGGMMAANSFSIAGSKFALSTANKWGNGVKSWAGRKSKGAARDAWDRARMLGKKTEGKETTTQLQRVGSRLQRVPGLRKLGTVIAKQGHLPTAQKGRAKDIEGYLEDIRTLDNQGLLARSQATGVLTNRAEMAAIAQELGKRGLIPQLNAINDKLVEKYVENAEKLGNAETMYSNRPDLAGIGKTAAERLDAIIKATGKIKTADVTNIDDSVLGSQKLTDIPSEDQIAIALSLSSGHLNKLALEGSSKQTEAVRNTLIYLQEHPELLEEKWSGDENRERRESFKKEIDRVATYIKKNINWQDLPSKSASSSGGGPTVGGFESGRFS